MEIKVSQDIENRLRWASVHEATRETAQMPGAEVKFTQWDSGKLIWTSYNGKNFRIDVLHCTVTQPLNLIIETKQSSPLMFIAWENEIAIAAADLPASFFPVKHMNILFSASDCYTLTSNKKGNYQVICIELVAAALNDYKMHSPLLTFFLENILKNMPAALLPNPIILPYEIIEVLTKIITCKLALPLSTQYLPALVIEILTLLVVKINLLSNEHSAKDLLCAEMAREIILKDLEAYHTVKELGRLTGTTDIVLQRLFKSFYGQSVGNYSREVRLAEAYKLLEQTDYPLRVICTMVGYNDAPNFFVAFKKQYGFTPGKIQLRRKM